MKKLTYVLLFSVSFLLIGNRSQAQSSSSPDYTIAAGLKFGAYEIGPSGKYFINDKAAIEGILGIRDHGLVITGLYELHVPAFNVDKLKFYYGFGGHLGSIGSGYYKRFGSDDQYYRDRHLLLGADGVIGLEWVVPNSPIAVSLDLNPRLEVATGPFFDIAPGVGVKYTFR